MFSMNFSRNNTSSSKSRPPRFLISYQSRGEALNPNGTSENPNKVRAKPQYSIPSKISSGRKPAARSFMSMYFQSGANSEKAREKQIANMVSETKKTQEKSHRWRFHIKNEASALMTMPNGSKISNTIYSRPSNDEINIPIKDYTFKTTDGHLVVGGRKYPIQPAAMHKLADIPVESEESASKSISTTSIVAEDSLDSPKKWTPSFKVDIKEPSKKIEKQVISKPVEDTDTDIKRNLAPSVPKNKPKPLPSWER
tara:strand:- start:3313 stop:4074 length:762 start_codon:yes stop_codon:yes gene_type:complete